MSALPISINQQDIYTALVPFLMTVTGLPAAAVIQGLPNRSAMPPPSPGFVTVQTFLAARLRTNVETWDTVGPNPTTKTVEQGTKVRVQLDFYGATAWDWAVALQTLSRDEYMVDALAPNVAPLYADDPLLAPLDDSEDQYESRYMLNAYIQYNPAITLPQDFAQAGAITAINTDEAYPP